MLECQLTLREGRALLKGEGRGSFEGEGGFGRGGGDSSLSKLFFEAPLRPPLPR